MGGRTFERVCIHVIECLPGQPPYVDPAAVGSQIVPQIPVAQAAVFGIDFPHHSHILDRAFCGFYCPERRGDLPAPGQDLPMGGSADQILIQGVHPLLPEGLHRAGTGLQRAQLVPGDGQCVSPDGGSQGFADHARVQGQRVLSVDAPDVERDQGNLRIAGPVQDPPQNPDEAGAPAFISRLADEDAAGVRIVLP